ncbi:hypothetical protein ABKN59_009203 [Abortiporus biennis]
MEPPVRVVRCNDLWYDDGGVVLQAESTLFRVYPGILATHSIVFKNKFASLKSENREDMYDGECPLVHIPGEKAADVRIFLLALYDPRRNVWSHLNHRDINKLTSLLRVADILQVSFIRDEVCRILSISFPSNFDEFQSIIRDYPSSLPFDVENKWRLFELANIIRSMDKHLYLLPPILYMISLFFTAKEIALGYTFPGTDQDRNQVTPVIHLSNVNIESILNALILLDRIAHSTTYYNNPCSTSRQHCANIYQNAIHTLEAKFQILPLHTWPEETSNFCDNCRRTFVESENKRIRGVWRGLPEYFGLRRWKYLGKPRTKPDSKRLVDGTRLTSFSVWFYDAVTIVIITLVILIKHLHLQWNDANPPVPTLYAARPTTSTPDPPLSPLLLLPLLLFPLFLLLFRTCRGFFTRF